MFLLYLKYLIIYLSHLAWPAAIYLFFQLLKQFSWLTMASLTAVLLFIYARFVEPRRLTIKHLKLKINRQPKINFNLRIGVLADIHCGVYEQVGLLARAVEHLNKQNPDLVFLPGDFVYNLAASKIKKHLEPLKNLKAPAFAVTGNHDYEHGRFSKKAKFKTVQLVRDALSELGARVIDNKITTFKIKDLTLTLFGLADIWVKQADFSILNSLPSADLVIGLVHNPDAVYEFKDVKTPIDLIVCGHTHGGQIRIP